MFAEAIDEILKARSAPEQVRAIEGGASARALTDAIADAGFLELLAAEEDGGGAASWSDFHDVVALCGWHAVPLPLVQTMAARALVARHADLPGGLLTIAPLLRAGADGGIDAPTAVPCARTADHVLGTLGGGLVLLPLARAEVAPTGIHGSLAASLRWPADAVARRIDGVVAAEALQAIAALLHAGLLAGAMKRAFDTTMTYANDRVQFGKSIGKFQAVQHQLAVMAEQVAAAGIAAQAGFRVADSGLPAVPACAVAKARTSEAAQVVAAIAHAVHGAIGVTAEYDLQLCTRRLHEWRMAHGSEACWQRVLGGMMLRSEVRLAAGFARGLFN